MAAPMRIRQPRNFRDRKDVLNELSDAELIKRYRLDRAGIMLVTDLVRERITNQTERSRAVTPEMKVLVTLRYLATGKMQLCSGDDLGPSQQTVSRVITETLFALSRNEILSQYFKFPVTLENCHTKAVDFQQIAGFPGVIGTIDGTHVRITAPKEFEAEYVNRKRYHSINVQVVFDATYRILDIVARWPGSVHDARILRESSLNQVVFGRGMVPDGYHLLGDSGYPCKKWLLTPYLRPQPGPQSDYNRAHKKTRNVVERGIGQLKRRFHVLHGEIRVTPTAKVCQIIKVCAMLHNICKDRNIRIPAPEDIDEPAEDIEEDYDNAPLAVQQPPLPPVAPRPREGLLYRDEFVNLHFDNDE
ncbi:hypothetical protein Pcinc_003442 [Petrolisthes cinctipes]|nr:hypothetical protein Pcinc_043494 [Petrolisthes cinctipes]KAK3876769.1 hypothetical protein Pcinc_018466 [Petrolisthes cinctipes]KAK3876775.1 hypothetical protein Pcinc_018471 [Petrolisthes cinctipes]KAK3881559.1 hypothetical protein Pcinc_013989 [Petrolisthes cinctipes]KAK3884920.1 hypothetical protein Pcinc_010763 [Petrolisthes cinctipes]